MKRLNYLWLIIFFGTLSLSSLYGVEPDGHCDGDEPGTVKPTPQLTTLHNDSKGDCFPDNPTFRWCTYIVGEEENSRYKAKVKILICEGEVNIGPWPQTPNPVQGGNVTSNNWQEIVADLQDYNSPGSDGAGPIWHSVEATEAHEMYHWNQDWLKTCIMAYWPACEAAIESYEEKDDKVLSAKVNQRFQLFVTQTKSKWLNEIKAKDEPGFGGGAYAAGQAVLNLIIADVIVFADQQGWDE